MSGELERGPGPGALPDPDRVVIPDDAAELDSDLWAWRAEQLRSRRPTPWTHPMRSTRMRVAGRVIPMVLGSLLLVAFLASLATTVRPATVEAVPAAPLATTSVPDGQVGGLLPPGIVDVDGATRTTRDLRPATLVMLPSAGASQRLLDAVHLQAQAYGIPLALVGPPERETLMRATSSEIGAGTVPVVVDRASAIAESVGLAPTSSVTIIVVGTDGRIHAVVRNPADGVQLQPVLSRAVAGADPVG
jgi:hypothetical protein